ncbi:MAG: thiamine phosphate synthase [Candidatus Omnitrophica bacterium]|nr:thiamine phosphate synthase [Candidatus Omnitrophota bacterium]
MKIKDKSLYLVTSQEFSGNKDSFYIAKEAIEAGVDILQMREKTKTRPELVSLGKKLCCLCRDRKVLFIVNDDPFLAKEVDANGVHLGQEDIKKHSIQEVRNILGKEKIIGLSTHSVEQFLEANEKDIDYIAFGPIFQTKTKNYCIGEGDVERVLTLSEKPIVFIGGINLDNIGRLVKKGAKHIAVIRAITEAEDITVQVHEFKKRINDV